MITQRLTGDRTTSTGRLVIETDAGNANSLAELEALYAELALRANIRTEGSRIEELRVEDVPPMPPAEQG